jgi:hypothetical protein
MCVIYACHEKLPDEDQLRAGAFRNSDGAGVAWLGTKGKVQWVKGLKSDHEEVREFIEKENIKFPLAIHFRNASAGMPVCDELCHPFPVSEHVETYSEGEAEQLLMHNGHVHDWDKHFLHALYTTDALCPEGKWSDSRALAFLVAMKGPGILNFVGGRYGRVLLFQGTPFKGRKPKSLDRFFKIYGDWEKIETAAQLGYYQSISVDTWTNRHTSGKGSGTTRHVGGTGRSSDSTITGDRTLPASVSSGTKKKKTTDEDEVKWPDNSWTIDELEEICKALEEEQDNARRLIGG